MLPSLTPFITRRSIARLLSTLTCSILVAVHPFSSLGGPLGFLILTIKELVFSVQENLAQQLEVTVLNVTGAMVGIGISTFARYVASTTRPDSAKFRAIYAIFLVLIAFFAGWVKSRLPRLTLSMRISCFLSIWMLTRNLSEDVESDARYFVWITLSPAIISLFFSMLLLRWSSTEYAEGLSSAFSMLHRCLTFTLDHVFLDISPPSDLRDLHSELLARSITLNSVYCQAVFELRVGRVGVKSIKPFISVVEHLRRELPRLMHLKMMQGNDTISGFREPAMNLGVSILQSMKAVEQIVAQVFHEAPLTAESPPFSESNNASDARVELDKSIQNVKSVLEHISDSVDTAQRTGSDSRVPAQIYDACLFMTSLLQVSLRSLPLPSKLQWMTSLKMAQEMRHALRLASNIGTLHRSSSLRLWHPRLSKAWLGAAPRTFVLEERGTFLDEELPDTRTTLSPEEALQGLAEHRHTGLKHVKVSSKIGKNRLLSQVSDIWNFPRTVRLRTGLSRFLRSIEHSPHFRHASKNAAGVALLSIPAFLPSGSAGRNWFISVHGEWMIISYVWVLETNTGATGDHFSRWRVGYLRLTGTILGALYAYITWLICRNNIVGIIAMTTLAEIPISRIVTATSFPSLGVVASVTLPPIVFAQYFQPNPSILGLAVLRGLMIGAGIIAALGMNSLVLPRHCRVLFLNSTADTIGLLSQLYLALGRNLFHNFFDHSGRMHHNTQHLRLELRIRNALHRLYILILTMNDELSLEPKPMQRYRRVVQTLQDVLNLMTALRKIRQKIPRKETVTPVFIERREFVSCICICLFACEQVFRAGQPLPQFLPSARQALRKLETHVEERIREARQENPTSLGLSLVYAFAEGEILQELVDALEELQDISRQLFGTAAWLGQSLDREMTMISTHEEAGSP